MTVQDIYDQQLKLCIQRLFNLYSTMTPNHQKCKEVTKQWFITQHSSFNWCAPLEFIQKGQGQKVINYIENLIVKSQIP